MSKCDIKIELDHPGRQFRAGEMITGAVFVRVNRECRCDGLDLEFNWETEGVGARGVGKPYRTRLFEGEWDERQIHRYPFEFRAPNGPHSYSGRWFNIAWAVRARADIPWGIDPKAEEKFVLLGGPATAPDTYINSPTGHCAVARGTSAKTSLLKVGAVLASFPCIGLGLLVLATLFDGALGAISIIYGIAVAAAFLVAGGGLAFWAGRNLLAARKLGKIDVQLPPQGGRLGQPLDVQVHLPEEAREHVDAIQAKLTCTELSIRKTRSGLSSNSQSHKVTRKHTIHRGDYRLSEGIAAQDSPFVLGGALPIPADAPPSFFEQRDKIAWKLELRIYVPDWPDWQREYDVLVVPPRWTERLEARR